MQNERDSLHERLLNVYDLTMRLEEAQETLRAIRHGEIDALVVNTGGDERVYTLKGADYAYQVLFDSLNEGALILGPDGRVLYVNARFAEMVGLSAEQVCGSAFSRFVASRDRSRFVALLEAGIREKSNGRVLLYAANGR